MRTLTKLSVAGGNFQEDARRFATRDIAEYNLRTQNGCADHLMRTIKEEEVHLRQRMSAFTVYMILESSSSLFISLIFTVNLVYHLTVVELNPLQLVLIGTILEATVFIFEIPTGVLADGQIGGGPAVGAIGNVSIRAALVASALMLSPVLPLYSLAIRRGERHATGSGSDTRLGE